MFRLMIFLALIALLLVLESVQVVQAGAPAPAPTVCRPNYTKKRNVCEKLITNCAAIYLPMKWVGKGCRQLPGHKPLGDGGCQCKGYCGYSCKTPCVKDKECYWNAAAKSCYVKATNEKGVPIDPCPNSTDTKSPVSVLLYKLTLTLMTFRSLTCHADIKGPFYKPLVEPNFVTAFSCAIDKPNNCASFVSAKRCTAENSSLNTSLFTPP